MSGRNRTIVAALLILDQLGVNITPLIAGASVFGLAVSLIAETVPAGSRETT